MVEKYLNNIYYLIMCMRFTVWLVSRDRDSVISNLIATIVILILIF